MAAALRMRYNSRRPVLTSPKAARASSCHTFKTLGTFKSLLLLHFAGSCPWVQHGHVIMRGVWTSKCAHAAGLTVATAAQCG
eukprot:8304125-Pyramimonas_sp.AAC.2